ncbi:hypothetical protein F2Q70_00035665 [Brassica cretica]|uniref:Uncharacterized protein n=2 Tax=Brassica cretica TaxID=69181 RepID=A0A3N6S1B5_BRACR|nr:hypothetical protein F2Q68_00030875 [Brassica cretica]KAF2587020.1 hypothetical protein F2Q70_00035665 [Brassica cretica]KAF3529157.1 hypothetical protein DY000_02039582 [Brassica cretica]
MRVFHLASIDYIEDLVTYNAADHNVEQVRLFLSLVFTTMSMQKKSCVDYIEEGLAGFDLDIEQW